MEIGDKIHCHSWRDLKKTALNLSSEGYGVTVIGFSDMSNNILTITALLEKTKEDKTNERLHN